MTPETLQTDVLIIGGGAAGFFAAINAALQKSSLKIIILEKNREVLQKVKVSGGGRCNVTHACFEAEELIKFYPRGNRELLEPFRKFNPENTIQWFEKQSVHIKKEADGRMFPSSNSSQTIIDCFLDLCQGLNIHIRTSCKVENIEQKEGKWVVQTNQNLYSTKKLMIATGNSQSVWELLKKLDLKIIPPVPSLFTFNCKDNRIADLMGLSVENVQCTLLNAPFKSEGALLITHWGFSGPAILKLSAWAARELEKWNYQFKCSINWLNINEEDCKKHLHHLISSQAKKNVMANAEFGLPIRLWKSLCLAAGISEYQKWAETGKKHIQKLAEQLTKSIFEISGKSTFKDEFVTAGGVDLEEMDLTRFATKKYPTLFLAGEVLNIDAVTGGFNFQAAWTGGFLAAQALVEE